MKTESISEWQLERFALGELPEAEKRRIERILKADPELQDKLRRLRETDREILETIPPAQFIPRIMAQVQQRIDSKKKSTGRPTPLFRLFLLPSAVVLLAVIGWFSLRPFLGNHPPATGDPQSTIRVKGQAVTGQLTPALHVFRKQATGAEELGSGAHARAHDLLQLAYSAGNSSHGAIFSIDGAGTITLHFPEQPSGNTRLRKAKLTFLEKSYELDDAPRYERFFFLHSHGEFDLAAIMKKAQQLAADPIRAQSASVPFSGQQLSLLILKGE